MGRGCPTGRVRRHAIMKRSLVPIARKLRRQQTPSEARLWSLLRDRRFFNHKFRRQFPIGPYIVDFCSRQDKLVIEVDGGGHDDKRQRQVDRKRDAYLQATGYIILRVWSNEVENNLEGVAEQLVNLLTNRNSSHQ